MSDHDLDVCAHLVRIAHAFCGSEGTRFYIRGVRIEPCPTGGVILVATDGHALIAIHDAEGSTKRPVTIRLKKSVRHSWHKRSRTSTRLRMQLTDMVNARPAWIVRTTDPEHANVLALVNAPEVDGTYPDWRRVVPGLDGLELPGGEVALLQGRLLKRFARASFELGYLVDPSNVSRAVALHSAGPNAPTYVRFAKGIPAFGALMPMREEPTVAKVPAWALRPTTASEPAS